ncbi:Syntaxin-18 [Vanrija pseudolonga]|uniref:Syntaxin-18 n=1 Tax=Vanrija pseudolonga TaxID=143232 RepID=A0AAF0YB07_9TREE|nr:Syntaxin-18 [Vanrija pseudolonga]
MVYIDQTGDFRSLIAEGSKKAAATPGAGPSKSRKPLAPKQDDRFLKEAYQIYGHLSELQRTLKAIRKPYLSTDVPPPLSRRARNDGGDELKRYEGSKYLSERERDEIDVRTKMILRRCRERVGDLEAEEKARQAKTAPPASALFQLLPSLAPVAVDTSEPLLTAHRSSIIWTLTNLLAKLSATQADMQEERAKRREERSRTLGGGATREIASLQVGADLAKGKNAVRTVAPAALPIIPTDEAPIEQQLSAAQLQQFESENSTLLNEMESQLNSVLAAEKSLLEISAMQTELVRHLVQQTEITDRLYDEAVGSVAEMGKANQQLKKAKERSGEARLFLLVFLFGASFALLFLNWYA